MGVRKLVSRLNSTRRPKDEKETPDNNDGGAVNEDDPPSPSQRRVSSGDNMPELAPYIAKPAKGLRKAAISNRHPSSREHHTKPEEPRPTDYLYFGEGTSSANISRSLSTQARTSSATDRSQTSSRAHYVPNPTGKDTSGFPAAGLDQHTSQMGYSSVTYGGSLQYDYAGTQQNAGPGL
ncbi:hypothetical protein F4779DRAFT_489056 [Xylariaceae sp. FL0662B]|nr:hypothetical protein F4779DRAFT_489056 [Xylariaceae sp. FL0662B]